MVLAADVVYDEEVVEDLVLSLFELSDENSLVILGFERHPKNERPTQMFQRSAGLLFEISQVIGIDWI